MKVTTFDDGSTATIDDDGRITMTDTSVPGVDYATPLRDVVVLVIDIDATKIADWDYQSEVEETLRAYLASLEKDRAGRHECEEYVGPRGTRLTITSSRL